VGEGGLEPPPPCGDMALNHARLPVPPLALVYTLNLRKRVLSGCSESIAAAQVATDAANRGSGYSKQLSRTHFGSGFGSALWLIYPDACVRQRNAPGEMTRLRERHPGIQPRAPLFAELPASPPLTPRVGSERAGSPGRCRREARSWGREPGWSVLLVRRGPRADARDHTRPVPS
jgi:hypothetical protein